MRIAYLILAHNTPHHMSRLIAALNSDNVEFYIHIDKKSDLALFKCENNFKNVHFLDQRTSVHWGDFSTVIAILDLIREALKSQEEFSYLCLLSGSDYPLRSNFQIEDFLNRNNGSEFIEAYKMPSMRVNKTMGRLESYQIQSFSDNRQINKLLRILNHGIVKSGLFKRNYIKGLNGLVPYAGKTWWILSREACAYVLKFVKENKSVIKFFRNTVIPDESVIHTIILNSKFAQNVKYGVTYTDWLEQRSSPALLTADHLVQIKNRIEDQDSFEHLVFARKFDDDSLKLTTFIDTVIIGKN